MTMTPAQYRDAIERLGLTPMAAATFLGIGNRTARRIAATGKIPNSVGHLLRVMIAFNLTPEQVDALTGE